MPTLEEISQKADELQTALDTEQEQIKKVIDDLNAVVADLQGQVAEGGTPEERQAVLDKLNASIADLQATIADAPPPPPEE